MATIVGSSLRAAREQADVSQRGAARLVAGELGRPDREEALALALSRIERGRGNRLDQETLEALATVLGVGERDLGEPARWAYAHQDAGGELRLGMVALRLLLFSTADAAFDARFVLEDEDGRVIGPLIDAEVVPVFASAVESHLCATFGAGLTPRERAAGVSIDPPVRELAALREAQALLDVAGTPALESALVVIGAAEHDGRFAGHLELCDLSTLAMRRVRAEKAKLGVADPESLTAAEALSDGALAQVLARREARAA